MHKEHAICREDKIKWFGEGEWVDEPDLIEFEYKGFLCKVVRILKLESNDSHYFGGHLCGYVSIPSDHPLYNIHYNKIDLEVHCGLTFSDFDEYNNYLIGFDCAHSGDYVPSWEKLRKEREFTGIELFPIPEQLKHHDIFNPTYKNINYCVEECKNIVNQLIEIKNANSTPPISR